MVSWSVSWSQCKDLITNFINNLINFLGGRIPNPIRTWEESDLPTEILDIVKKLNYTVSYARNISRPFFVNLALYGVVCTWGSSISSRGEGSRNQDNAPFAIPTN